MQLLAPDILADARELSVALLAAALVLGLALWLLGWRGHRFWIVLATTVGFGIFGLASGPAYGTQPLLAGLLLAVAAGTLALALVRVVVFAAGGLVSWAVLHAVFPAWNEPLVGFLLGGLVGLLLFRLWTMALTSGAGTLLMAYAGLCLADRLGKVNAVALADKQSGLINGACGAVALTGFAVQFYLERRRGRKEPNRERRPHHRLRDREERNDRDQRSRTWWNWTQRTYRRAG